MKHKAHTNPRSSGFSLVELMAATAILTLLSVMAVPYAQTSKDREQEVQLIDSLTRIREAIELYAWNESNGDEDNDGVFEEDPAGDPDGDGIFDDDRDGRVDEDGFPNYPPSLQALVDKGYLSSIPPDPFASAANNTNWTLIRINRTSNWIPKTNPSPSAPATPSVLVNGILDVRSQSKATALNGSKYDTW